MVFPTSSRSGRIEESIAKEWHGRALATLEKAHEENTEKFPEVKPFEPFCLRHTASTWLAKAGCDAFTLAGIAEDPNIMFTQRYIYPAIEAIAAALRKLVTNGGHQEISRTSDANADAGISVEKSNG